MNALALLTLAWCTHSMAAGSEFGHLLPQPKTLKVGHGRVRIARVVNARPASPAMRAAAGQFRAAAGLSSGANAGPALWLGLAADLPKLSDSLGSALALPQAMQRRDGHWVTCAASNTGEPVVACVGYDERGCYYGAQTLIQLLAKEDGRASIPRVEIVDWPSFSMRLVKNSASRGDPKTVEAIARLLPRVKINVYGLQFHQGRGSGAWREPGQRFVQNITTVGRLAREQGVLEPALFLCPFFKPKIDLSKPEEIDLYIERLKWGLRQGCRWVEVDFNDWGTWDKLNSAERAAFADLGDYMARLTNAAYEGVRGEFPNARVIVCPATQWYRGVAKPDLVALCKRIPQDVLVYWTGPTVRSRVISERQILAWTQATGRRPFLWDNTIYAHFQPFWVAYSLNPFWNQFPKNLPDLLAGGIHLNCTATPLYLPGILTFADYVWNPEAYDPERSIRAAMRFCWGPQGAAAGQRVRECIAKVHAMLANASAGAAPWDKQAALAGLEELDAAAARLGDAAREPALAALVRKTIAAPARQAVLKFKPPRLSKDYVRMPLADGVVNGGAEDVAGAAPLNWCLYAGAGRGRVTASDDAHTGKHSARLEALAWYHNPKHPRHGDRRWINLALVHGGRGMGGYQGSAAYDVEPNKSFRCTFWLKSDAPAITLAAAGWRVGFGPGARASLDAYPAEIKPTREWRRYSFTFHTNFDTRKVAIKFGLMGYQDAGARLASIWVDDLTIQEE